MHHGLVCLSYHEMIIIDLGIGSNARDDITDCNESNISEIYH